MADTSARTPYIIGVSGGSGSGKSTLCRALLNHFNSQNLCILSEDDYYHPLRWHLGQPPEALDPSEIKRRTRHLNFDSPNSKDFPLLMEHIHALKRGETIACPVYDYTLHDRVPDRLKPISPRPLIIIEGIHTLNIESLDPLLDLRVYVDTPDDVRLARRIQRDVIERGRDAQSVLQQYLQTVRPAHYTYTHPAKFSADLVIADEGLPATGGMQASPEAIERLITPVLARIARVVDF